MKFRTGFVSNSSTTSFLVITTPTSHAAALEKLGELKAKAMSGYSGLKKRKVLGQDAIVLNYISGEGGDEWIADMFKAKALQAAFDASEKLEFAEDITYFAGELIGEYISKVRKQKDTYYQEEDY
ncbi:MAG: hypothetical protein M0R80_02530 [Proteobacteria bacterium]|jgi:hypothetical protein|nr:hypothetical protein [Pseudomonadota bacterium]